MFFSSVASSLILAAGLFQSALAHNIQLPAHGRECFHETLKRDDKMSVTFQVGDREFGSSGNLEIDFWVRWPFPPSPPLQNPGIAAAAPCHLMSVTMRSIARVDASRQGGWIGPN